MLGFRVSEVACLLNVLGFRVCCVRGFENLLGFRVSGSWGLDLKSPNGTRNPNSWSMIFLLISLKKQKGGQIKGREYAHFRVFLNMNLNHDTMASGCIE